MKIPSLLRPDLLKGSAFSVSQLPCKAKLDQNESPFEIPEEAKEVILSELAGAAWNRYPQPAQFLEVKEQFLLNIMGRFQEIGLEFAFPTQTVHIANPDSDPDAERPA